MKSQALTLPNMGVLQSKLPPKLWKRIKEVCVDNRCDHTADYHSKLAGLIKDEYAVEDKEIILGLRDHAADLIEEYYSVHGYSEPSLGCYTWTGDIWFRTKTPLPSYQTVMQADRNGNVGHWQETATWVNYQKKGEMNPIHNHTADFSIVVFCKIPYDFEEEKEYLAPTTQPDKNLKYIVKESDLKNMITYNQNGNFGFSYCMLQGATGTGTLNLDQSYEGTMLLFPGSLMHFVYPFYTSDEERITISANYKLMRGKPAEIQALQNKYD